MLAGFNGFISPMESGLPTVQPCSTLMMGLTKVHQTISSIDEWDSIDLDDILDGALGHVIELRSVWMHVTLHGVNHRLHSGGLFLEW